VVTDLPALVDAVAAAVREACDELEAPRNRIDVQ
jgi:hypothetical protein